MSQDQRGRVHQVLRAVCPELEPDQPAHVDHPDFRVPTEMEYQGPLPVHRDQRRQDVEADARQRPLNHPVGVALRRIAATNPAADALRCELLLQDRRITPREEVHVVGPSHVAPGRHGEAADQSTIVAEHGCDTLDRPLQVRRRGRPLAHRALAAAARRLTRKALSSRQRLTRRAAAWRAPDRASKGFGATRRLRARRCSSAARTPSTVSS